MFILARSTLLRGLPDVDLARLAGGVQRRRYDRREPLHRTGDASALFHVIEDGYAKLVLEHDRGDQRIVDILGPGSCLGELGLVAGARHLWTARALDPVTTACISCDLLASVLWQSPERISRILAHHHARIARLNTILGDAAFLSTRERIARCLLDLADRYGELGEAGIELLFSLVQADLAALVGATRPTISTSLGQLEDEGILRREPRRMLILDVAALRAVAALPPWDR